MIRALKQSYPSRSSRRFPPSLRFAYACLALLALDVVLLLVGLGRCVENSCPAWQGWLNLVTFTAAPVLFLLVFVGLLLTLLRARASHDEGFSVGERVVFVDGKTGAVRASRGGHSHVVWDDEPDLGGSRVPDSKLRRAGDSDR